MFISLTDVQITVPDPKQTATTAMAAVRGVAWQGTPEIAKDLLPTPGQAFDVTLQFSRVDDEWHVSAIEGISTAFLDRPKLPFKLRPYGSFFLHARCSVGREVSFEDRATAVCEVLAVS